MELSSIVPIATIEAVLGQETRVARLQTTRLDEVLQSNPEDLYGIAASTWHRIVSSGRFPVDPMQMSAYFQAEDPRLAHGIQQVIGQPMLKEFGFLRAAARHSSRLVTVATSSVAHLFSEELHLYDIALTDPRLPIPKRQRKSQLQHHRGFGLLSEVMRNLFVAARERHCRVITLTAGDRPLVEVFKRYGFTVEDNIFSRRALEFGVGIPMEAHI